MACRRRRTAFVPQPVMGKTADELRGYIDGIDPVRGRPVMQEIIEGLTRSRSTTTTSEDRSTAPTPRLVEPDSEENAAAVPRQQLDRQAADRPADGRARRGDAGPHQPQAGRSGRPHALDAISANTGSTRSRRSRSTRSWPARGRNISRSSWRWRPPASPRAAAPRARRRPWWSSTGRSATKSKMNSGTGAMGPFNHANATIGRAYGLLSQNCQGSSVPASPTWARRATTTPTTT